VINDPLHRRYKPCKVSLVKVYGRAFFVCILLVSVNQGKPGKVRHVYLRVSSFTDNAKYGRQVT
jgi:hypothetical protein